MSVAVSEPSRPASVAAEEHPIFAVAPADELLFSMSADGSRKFIHPVVRRGPYWRIRRRIAMALVTLFFALPLMSVGGYPAVWLDIATRRFHLFGGTFHPTDNLLLAAFGFGVVVTVFFVGSTFGRMWCGFACPQTIYLEFLFRPIEAWIEGGPTNQRRLNKAPLSVRKAAIKSAKWLLWSALALLMASTFVAYFTSWPPLIAGVTREPSAWAMPLGVIAGLTGLILFNFGWFRDQMCTIACPYGRLQNVIADRDTMVVAYDGRRGEPRMAPKVVRPGITAGDCVDCNACVSACPTGTDIRRGLQVECIGTAQCIDACDEVMLKLGRPTGLIRFTSEREQQGGVRHRWHPRNLVYLLLMTAAWGTLVALIVTRADALVEVVRGGREPYRLLTNGEVANQQRVRFTNQLDDTQRFSISIESPAGARLVVSESPIVVRPEQVLTVNAVTTVARDTFVKGQATVRYLVTSDKGYHKQIEFLLLGPFESGERNP